jgi:hypothetical protein
MTASGHKSLPAIGFLTVVEHPQHGLFGGYLLLNTAGRPLEFHCTAPVKANRAQQILYGPTLRPYLFGEQIGFTLLSKAKQTPLWVCTDREPVLAARELVEFPVVLIEDTTQNNSAILEDQPDDEVELVVWPRPQDRLDRTGPSCALETFPLGKYQAHIPRGRATDQQTVVEHWQSWSQVLDLLEPFARIRDAIEEAQRMAA